MLCAAVGISDRGEGTELTAHEVKIAPVWLLSRAQLEEEDRRLSDGPWLTHSVAAVAVGGGLALGTGIGDWILLAQLRRGGDNPGPAFGVIILSVFGATGAVMALIGGGYLPWVIGTKKANAERQAEGRARLATVREAPPPAPAPAETFTRLRALEDERPGYLLPVTLTAAGTVPLLVGLVSYLSLSRNASSESYAISIALMVGGLALEGLGLGLLVSAIRARADLDEEIRALEPPPLPPTVTALPPVPNHFALGGRF
jgi:hypothetical protein